VDLESFNKKWLGSNNEGAVNAIAYLPELLSVKMKGDKISIDAKEGSIIKLWQGIPSYEKNPLLITDRSSSFHLFEKLEEHRASM